jgi:hypothetical protein
MGSGERAGGERVSNERERMSQHFRSCCNYVIELLRESL